MSSESFIEKIGRQQVEKGLMSSRIRTKEMEEDVVLEVINLKKFFNIPIPFEAPVTIIIFPSLFYFFLSYS